MASEAATDTSDDDQPFRFIDLPRQMRDKIYDNLTNDEMPVKIKWKKDDDGRRYTDLTATIENAPLAACLRISRQFSNEYSESIERNQMTTLRMQDINKYYFSVPEFMRVMPLQHIHKLELQLATACGSLDLNGDDHSKCCCFVDLKEHKSFIDELASHSGFSRIKQYHISVCFNRWRAAF